MQRMTPHAARVRDDNDDDDDNRRPRKEPRLEPGKVVNNVCFECGSADHWVQNCPVRARKRQEAAELAAATAARRADEAGDEMLQAVRAALPRSQGSGGGSPPAAPWPANVPVVGPLVRPPPVPPTTMRDVVNCMERLRRAIERWLAMVEEAQRREEENDEE